jgi:hypothetical protein
MFGVKPVRQQEGYTRKSRICTYFVERSRKIGFHSERNYFPAYGATPSSAATGARPCRMSLCSTPWLGDRRRRSPRYRPAHQLAQLQPPGPASECRRGRCAPRPTCRRWSTAPRRSGRSMAATTKRRRPRSRYSAVHAAADAAALPLFRSEEMVRGVVRELDKIVRPHDERDTQVLIGQFAGAGLGAVLHYLVSPGRDGARVHFHYRDPGLLGSAATSASPSAPLAVMRCSNPCSHVHCGKR